MLAAGISRYRTQPIVRLSHQGAAELSGSRSIQKD